MSELPTQFSEGLAQSPYRENLIRPLVSAISFFQSLHEAHDNRTIGEGWNVD